MRRVLLLGLVAGLLPGFAAAQQLVDGFNVTPTDTNYWFIEAVASSDTSGVVLTYTDAQKVEGDSALKIDWTVQASESWGGFTNLMHMAPDSSVFDFSLYTHLSLWYYVESPSSQPGLVEFRILFKDVSDAPLDLEDITQAEFWYSHHQILDASPGWNELVMPLEDVGNMTFSQGFWLPGWAGAAGNGELNLDKIKAYKFEFSIDGTLYNAANPSESGVSVGTIYLDNGQELSRQGSLPSRKMRPHPWSAPATGYPISTFYSGGPHSRDVDDPAPPTELPRPAFLKGGRNSASRHQPFC